MNRLLANTLEILNIVLAIGIVLFSISTFSGVGLMLGFPPSLSLLLSLVIGVVIAAVVCGVIAMLALIEDHLRAIAGRGEFGGSHTSHRREPTVRMEGLEDQHR